MTSFRVTIGIIIFMGLTSCYREVEFLSDTGEVFELSVTPEMQDVIYNSRDSSYTINEDGVAIYLDGQPLDLDEIGIRGKSALRFQRKSYRVKLDTPVAISARNGSGIKNLSRFKLIAMAMDYTYIENRIGFGMLEEQVIMPLFYSFVEFKINGSTQGVYLLLEDPEMYYRENDSEFILRRGYYHSIADAAYAPSLYNIPRESYESRFLEIYSSLTSFQGEDLYNALNERLDLNQYFKKMGIDFLLQNGDYTDEVYLYALVSQDQIRFHIIPWDYDDLFRDNPHEVGITWGSGHLFGDRYYETRQDVLDEIGDKMIFSIEDDLDYVIAIDPYLYNQYERTLSTMVDRISAEDIDRLFDQVKYELTPFYENREIISQSRYDENETNSRLWEENMADKKTFLKERLEAMKEQLDLIEQ